MGERSNRPSTSFLAEVAGAKAARCADHRVVCDDPGAVVLVPILDEAPERKWCFSYVSRPASAASTAFSAGAAACNDDPER